MLKGLLRPWLGVALLAVLAYVIQLWPVTGIFLMMLGGVLWPGALAHVSMGLLIIDGVRGKTWPALLALPAAFYGYGFYLFLQSEADVNALVRDVAAQNVEAALPYDPATQIVLFSGDDQRTVNEVQGGYLLDLAFVRREYGHRPGAFHASFVLPRDECPELDRVQRESGLHRYGLHANRVSAANACRLEGPEDPDRPAINVVTSERKIEWRGREAHIRTSEISDGARRAVINSGYTYAYPPIPFFMAGCALDSGAAAWRCVTDFMPVMRTFGGARGQARSPHSNAVAQALGLEPRTVRVEKRRAIGSQGVINFAPDPHAAGLIAKMLSRRNEVLDAFFAELPRVVEERRQFYTRRPGTMAVLSPERNAEHVDLLLRGVATFAAEPRLRDERRILTRALVVLPDDVWMERQGAMMRLASQRNVYAEEDGFLIRLGDYGVAATPILLRELRNRNPRESVATAAAFGLCRAGAAANTPDVRAALAQPWRDGAVGAEGAFLALLRMDQREAAAAIRLGDHPRVQAWREEQMRTITSQSPRSACRPRERYPRVVALPRDMVS